MVDQVLFKICPKRDWRAAVEAGRFAGSPDDRRDGYIHLSTLRQVPRTLAKFFSGRSDLVLVAVDAAKLGDGLRWEKAGDGDLFPHLYADLRMDPVLWERPLAIDPAGAHVLPPEAG